VLRAEHKASFQLIKRPPCWIVSQCVEKTVIRSRDNVVVLKLCEAADIPPDQKHTNHCSVVDNEDGFVVPSNSEPTGICLQNSTEMNVIGRNACATTLNKAIVLLNHESIIAGRDESFGHCQPNHNACRS
jgi:hypothetical protein